MTPLARPVQEMQLINVFLVHQLNFSTLILVGMLVLMGVQTIFQLEILFAKLVTPLVRPVQEMD